MFKLTFKEKELKEMYELQAAFEDKLGMMIETNQMILALNYTTNALLKTLGAWEWWKEGHTKVAYDTIVTGVVDVMSVYFAAVYYTCEAHGNDISKIFLDDLKQVMTNEQFSDAEPKHLIEWFSLERSIMSTCMTQIFKVIEHYYPQLNAKDITRRFTTRIEERDVTP